MGTSGRREADDDGQPMAHHRTERRRGRPTKGTSAGLSPHILEIAFRQFLCAGFANTSMDSVAAEACISKRTLYDRFPSKVHLFEAALSQQVPSADDEPRVIEARGGTLEQLLLDLAHWLRSKIFTSRTISLYRLLAAEGHRHPELAVYSEGKLLRPIIESLASIFARAAERGEMPSMPPEFLASQFVQAICGGDIRSSIYGVQQPDDAGTVEQRVTMAVRLFLHGVRQPDAPPLSGG